MYKKTIAFLGKLLINFSLILNILDFRKLRYDKQNINKVNIFKWLEGYKCHDYKMTSMGVSIIDETKK